MLSFFRLNDPYRLLGLLILFLLISLPVFLINPGLTWPELSSFIVGEKINDGLNPYSELIDSTPLLSQWLYGLINWISGQHLGLRHGLGFVILFFQACYIGIVFINRKAFTENTYIPSLLFCLLCAMSFDMLSVTGTLLASGLLLLAINSLFREIEFREPNDASLIKSGVYLSLASLAVFSYIIFFLAAQIILVLFTRGSARRQFLFVIGFLLPHFLLFSSYYLMGEHAALIDFFYKANLFADERLFITWKTLLTIGAVPIAYFVISFFTLGSAVRLTNYQTQLLQSMFIWLLAGIVHLFFTRSLRPQSLLPLFPPLSFLLAHFLLSIQRKKLAELNLWILGFGIILSSYLVRLNYFTNTGYTNLLVNDRAAAVKDKRIWIIADDYSAYLNNKVATGFSDWTIAKTIVEQPDYYDHIIMVNEQLSINKPEIIIDPNNLLAAFLVHLPKWKKLYIKEGETYTLIQNNGSK